MKEKILHDIIKNICDSSLASKYVKITVSKIFVKQR